MSTLGTQSVSHLSFAYPRFGAWRADVVLTGGDVPSGALTLTVGDLEVLGTVLRGNLDAPGKPHAVVVGAPGWDRELVRPLSYRSDAGVSLSTVLKDLAALAGEPIEQPTDRTMGPHFVAQASSAVETVRLRDVLSALHRSGYLEPWRVDPDGTTRFGARVGIEVTARATPLRRSHDVGLVVYGIDSPKAFLPGNMVDGQSISRVEFVESSGKLEAEVWQQ